MVAVSQTVTDKPYYLTSGGLAALILGSSHCSRGVVLIHALCASSQRRACSFSSRALATVGARPCLASCSLFFASLHRFEGWWKVNNSSSGPTIVSTYRSGTIQSACKACRAQRSCLELEQAVTCRDPRAVHPGPAATSASSSSWSASLSASACSWCASSFALSSASKRSAAPTGNAVGECQSVAHPAIQIGALFSNQSPW